MNTTNRKLAIGVLLVVVAAGALFLLLRSRAPQPLEIGDKAIDFTVPRLGSGEVALKDYRHRVVVVNFWATWCPPCVEETPSLEKFAEQAKPYGVEVIGVSIDQDDAALRKFVRDYQLTYPIGRDPYQTVAGRYGTHLFPETYIVSRDGRVADKIISNFDWEDPRMLAYVRELAQPGKAEAGVPAR
jgi:cytochrome c biogenesis protein CcmG, thiol:disulfide interchange protein DsbE